LQSSHVEDYLAKQIIWVAAGGYFIPPNRSGALGGPWSMRPHQPPLLLQEKIDIPAEP